MVCFLASPAATFVTAAGYHRRVVDNRQKAGFNDGVRDLGVFSDWVDEAYRQVRLRPAASATEPTRHAIREVLGFCDDAGIPADVRHERTWERDGLVGEEVSWSVGFGTRTRAWVLRPTGSTSLPGVVALHCHSGMKFYGKEKVADGPGPTPQAVNGLREIMYGGRAFANELARRGFVVLVHDVFLWGSRRFPLEAIPARLRGVTDRDSAAGEDVGYDRTVGGHEDLVAKYCHLLGTTLAGVIAREDRAAVAYLRSRPDVRPGPVGCVGLSGGGCRAALLQATGDGIGAAVIVAMMSTHDALLDSKVDTHTWMLFPEGLARLCDWPDLAASRAPSPLLVQYALDDGLFTPAGMRAAHELIATRYAEAGRPDSYVGQFYDGPHRFDVPMQEAAFGWLSRQLDTPSGTRTRGDDRGRPRP